MSRKSLTTSNPEASNNHTHRKAMSEKRAQKISHPNTAGLGCIAKNKSSNADCSTDWRDNFTPDLVDLSLVLPLCVHSLGITNATICRTSY